MCVENPLLAFIDLVNKLRAGDVLTEDLKQPFSQVGINFISDSYRTALCLEFPPQKIAAACAFLTVVFLRAPPDDRPRTAALYGALAISERSLRSICTQMAELYVENKKCARLLRDLAEMGHVPAELVRPAPRPPAPPSDAVAGVTPSPSVLSSSSSSAGPS